MKDNKPLKLIITYIIYVAVLVICFSKNLLNMLNGTVLGYVCGSAVFLVSTGFVVSKTISTTKNDVPLLTTAKKDTPLQLACQQVLELHNYMKVHRNMGPFESMRMDLYDSTNGLVNKYANIIKLMKESFSEGDLTYVTYSDTLDEVLNLAANNIKGIHKRLSVFDYTNYQKHGIDTLGNQYVTEVTELSNNLNLINQKMDNLIHELVSLDVVSDESLLNDLNEMINQTKLYNKN